MSLDGRTVALVEDDLIMGESLVDRLGLEGARVLWWRTRRDAADGLARARPDLVVCDLRLPDGSGEEVLRAAVVTPDAPPFLFVTAYGDIDQAVRLMREGAGDYLTKPFDMETFLDRARQLMRPLRPEGEGALGISAAICDVERLLRRVAPLSSPVLLTGETGSGKEVCARFLHDAAGRPSPFVAVNCAAIPRDLLESELLGHERGAFTGASARHRGFAERAGAGILFLDEIGELDPRLQAKLLRLLEERYFHRLGGEAPVPFKARLVCATNADLDARVRDGTFREDLLYRINVIHFRIPPLRERPDDVEWLVGRFLAAFSGDRPDAPGIGEPGMRALREHRWPGNVRELRNRVERAVALGLGPWISPGDLFPERSVAGLSGCDAAPTLEIARDEAERREIRRALLESDGQVGTAAARLGIARTTMWEKMKRHGIAVVGAR